MRKATLAIGLLATIGVAGCSGPADPPTASPGFFPATYTGATVAAAPLVKSAEVSARTTHFTFHVSVPSNQPYVVVVRCDSGQVEMRLPNAGEHGPCRGLLFLDNGCVGHNETFKVSVSQRQSGSWGVALYTGRHVADATCNGPA